MRRVCAYARVSNREQAENSRALEQQIDRLVSAGADLILKDVETGTKDDRVNFQRLTAMIRNGEISEVIVTRIDRLSRSLLTLRETIELMQRHGVNFRALDDAIDLRTAGGKFHLNMLGALAEMESDRLSERVMHGWNHLRKRRVAMNPPFGYAKVDDRHQLDNAPFLCLLATGEERSRAQIAREIVETFLEVRTLRMALRRINEKYGIQTIAHNNKLGAPKGGRVAQQLFRFSPTGLSTWLHNPVLRGHLCYLRSQRSGLGKRQRVNPEGWLIIRDTHPNDVVMNEAEYQQIKAILEGNAKHLGFTSTSAKYPLAGLVYCGECRSAMYSVSGRKNYKHPERGYNHYFQCKNWKHRGCTQQKMIRMDLLEDAVIDRLVAAAESIAANIPIDGDAPTEPDKEVLRLQHQIERIDRMVIEFGDDDGLMQKQRSILENRIAVLVGERVVDIREDALRRTLVDGYSSRLAWDSLNQQERRELFQNFVSRITVCNGQAIEMQLRFN